MIFKEDFKNVSVGKYIISKQNLVVYGLGSCVGIVLYHSETKTVGLIHAFLPDSKKYSRNKNECVDCMLDSVFSDFSKLGISPQELSISLYGGGNSRLDSVFKIGSENISAACDFLDSLNLKYSFGTVGGNTAKTVRVCADDGKIMLDELKIETGV